MAQCLKEEREGSSGTSGHIESPAAWRSKRTPMSRATQTLVDAVNLMIEQFSARHPTVADQPCKCWQRRWRNMGLSRVKAMEARWLMSGQAQIIPERLARWSDKEIDIQSAAAARNRA